MHLSLAENAARCEGLCRVMHYVPNNEVFDSEAGRFIATTADSDTSVGGCFDGFHCRFVAVEVLYDDYGSGGPVIEICSFCTSTRTL